ncbi:MAG: hypothetical protein PHD81_00940 [Candidatus Nanoarchaeia archaeon]|nr:hypothetical protein [Candidatus Nanoarchaeia archaeon]MDD5587656.1 hypothetical protein [Candidatus Nanoarchaeia archaeon]
MNKKADVEMQETMIVIFVFMILLAFGLMFFVKYNAVVVKELGDYDKTLNFYSMVSVFPNLPEVKCSSIGQDLECVDILKLIAFKNKGDFGNMNITVYQVYPSLSNGYLECNLNALKLQKNCTIYNVYSSIPGSYESKEILNMPVSLYNPLTDQYAIGNAVLELYR